MLINVRLGGKGQFYAVEDVNEPALASKWGERGRKGVEKGRGKKGKERRLGQYDRKVSFFYSFCVTISFSHHSYQNRVQTTCSRN